MKSKKKNGEEESLSELLIVMQTGWRFSVFVGEREKRGGGRVEELGREKHVALQRRRTIMGLHNGCQSVRERLGVGVGGGEGG